VVGDLPPPINSFSCTDLNQSSCDADKRCQSAYQINAPCLSGSCPELVYESCIAIPDSTTYCPQVLCEEGCAFGQASDINGCPSCACLPPNIPCEEMNETQCNATDDCLSQYSDQTKPAPPTGGATGGAAPCRDPDCGDRRRPPPPSEPVFEQCIPNEVETCFSDQECPGGYCGLPANRPQDRNGESPNGNSGALPSRPPMQCIYPACSDGSTLTCDRAQPTCDANALLTVRENCWLCVNPESCEPHHDEEEDCTTPPGVQRAYFSSDIEECRQVMGFVCSGDSTYFINRCGCGCDSR
jgi:hypothetical protein